VEDQTSEGQSVQRLLGIYQEKVVPALQEEFKYGNKFEVRAPPIPSSFISDHSIVLWVSWHLLGFCRFRL
jgi:hypothetical protein